MIIFGDESGWTGPDLLDDTQPVLALATLRLSESEASDLADRFFGGFPGSEIKFKTLSQSSGGQKAILEFLQWVAANGSRQRTYVVNKRYALVGKLVDTLVENAVYAKGGDLYANGGHITLMRALHHGLPKFAGEHFYAEFLRRFQTLARKPTRDALVDFFMLVSEPTHTQRLKELLAPLRNAREVLDDGTLLEHLCQAGLDVLGASLWAVACAWNRAAPSERLHVVFDEQSRLKAETQQWEVLRDPLYRIGPPTVARVPVLDEFEFGDSSDHPGIQLADILAGSWRFMLGAHVSPAKMGHDRQAALRPELSALVGQLQVQLVWPGDHNSPESGLMDYDNAQRLIDATVVSILSKQS